MSATINEDTDVPRDVDEEFPAYGIKQDAGDAILKSCAALREATRR